MESVLFLHPFLDFIICRFAFRAGQIQFIHIDLNTDMMPGLRKFGQKPYRLYVARGNDITGTYLIPVRAIPDRNISTVLGTWAFAHEGTYRQTGICHTASYRYPSGIRINARICSSTGRSIITDLSFTFPSAARIVRFRFSRTIPIWSWSLFSKTLS